jgi:hypothetical protein
MWGTRTWQVFAGDNFLGYEYGKDQEEVYSKAIKKFGAPEKWGIESYTVKLILWPAEIDQLTC